jgi:hypothetical protein
MTNTEKMAIQRRTSRRRGSRKVTKNRAQEAIQRRDNPAVYTAKRTVEIFYQPANRFQASTTVEQTTREGGERVILTHKNGLRKKGSSIYTMRKNSVCKLKISL